jgi:hypothetical protein
MISELKGDVERLEILLSLADQTLNEVRRDCFTLGEKAHADGLDITDNPFGEIGEASKQWGQGWLTSERATEYSSSA